MSEILGGAPSPDLPAEVVSDLIAALKMTAERWQDVGQIIRDDGEYDNAGFCRRSAERCLEAVTAAEAALTTRHP